MLKRNILVKNSLRYIFISVLPLFFVTFFILHYAVKEQNNVLRDKLYADAEQTVAILQYYLDHNNDQSVHAITESSRFSNFFRKLHRQSSILFFVDAQGNIVFKSIDMKKNLINPHTIKNLYLTWRRNPQESGNSEHVIEEELEDGRHFLVLLHRFPRIDKTIILLEPAVSYILLLKNFYPPLLIILVFILGIVIPLNYYTYIQFFRPIHRLTQAASKVANKDFDVTIINTNNNEIGRLTHVFNKSIAQIRAFNQMNIDKIIVERKKLEHIIEQLVGGLLIIDPENKIAICNHVLAGWYHLDKQAIINKKLTDIQELQVYHDMIKELTLQKNNDTIHKKITLDLPEPGKTLVFQASATNIFTSGNTFLGTSIYIRDITKEHEIDQLKSELISFVAHELRSPLVSIIGFSEILLEDEMNQKLCKEYLSIIHSESSRLSEFVDNFLDLTQIESGKLSFNLKEADFIKTVKEVINLYKMQAEAKKIKINTDFKPALQVVKYDCMLIERAIGNYLSNAIKYNPPETHITVKTYTKDDWIYLEVIDTGIGIPPNEIDKIFNKFYKIPSPSPEKKKGSGLGLSFVKQVIDKHNGKIYVESTPGQGSVFGFTLPL